MNKIAAELTQINLALLRRWPGQDLKSQTKAEMVKFYKHWNDIDDIVYDIRQFPLMYEDDLIMDAKNLLVQTDIFIGVGQRDREDWEGSFHFEAFRDDVVPDFEDYLRIMDSHNDETIFFRYVIDGLVGTDKKAEWLTLCKIADNISRFKMMYMEMLVGQLRELALGTIINIPNYRQRDGSILQ